jgi:hypothetical protein
VLVPLVLPEGLVVAAIIFPVLGHVGEELGAALVLEDGGDVGVLARFIAKLLVCAVAVVRPGLSLGMKSVIGKRLGSLPESVNGPRVAGTRGWVVVPELGQKKGSSGGVEAAGGLLGGG